MQCANATCWKNVLALATGMGAQARFTQYLGPDAESAHAKEGNADVADPVGIRIVAVIATLAIMNGFYIR